MQHHGPQHESYAEWQAAKQALLGNDPQLRKLYAKALARRTWLPDEHIPTLAEIADIANHRHVAAGWLIKQIGNGALHTTELEDAQTLIHIFERHKQAMAPSQRDIAAYKSFADFRRCVKSFFTAYALPHVNKHQAAVLANGEAEVIDQSEQYTAVRIKSVAAAIAFESGRNWCTSYTRAPNLFYSYASAGAVIDLINEHGHARYGLCYNHVNNISNYRVGLVDLLKHDPSLIPVLEDYLILHIQGRYLANEDEPFRLQDFPERYHTPRLCAAVEAKGIADRNAYAAGEMEPEHPSLQLRYHYTLMDIPFAQRTMDMYSRAINEFIRFKQLGNLSLVLPEMPADIADALVAKHGLLFGKEGYIDAKSQPAPVRPAGVAAPRIESVDDLES